MIDEREIIIPYDGALKVGDVFESAYENFDSTGGPSRVKWQVIGFEKCALAEWGPTRILPSVRAVAAEGRERKE